MFCVVFFKCRLDRRWTRSEWGNVLKHGPLVIFVHKMVLK